MNFCQKSKDLELKIIIYKYKSALCAGLVTRTNRYSALNSLQWKCLKYSATFES